MSASQTVGPFFRIGLEHLHRADLAISGTPGTVITIRGRILDGDGHPVPDAELEFWQADAQGNFSENKCEAAGRVPAEFTGFARIPSDEAGHYELRTIMPGGVANADGGRQAPHLAVFVFMRGLLKPLYTRIYFAGERANDADPVLNLVPLERRATLIASQEPGGESFAWNVKLQGPDETAFFEY
jgi:protocatechuate 3,4-dioxygenase, alpha subunit